MIKELYQLQNNLDKLISNKFVNEKNQNQIFNLKIISLYVELGELANETRCFKYWSVSRCFKSLESVIEEYADGLHFLLSIGNDLDQNKDIDYSYIFKSPKISVDNEVLNNYFLKLFEIISKLNKTSKKILKKDIHLNLMEQYFILGYKLGLTYEDIFQAYKSKNNINLQRLANNY